MNIQYQKWHELLNLAITEPGMILKAYSNFHPYSIGNQIAALSQCHHRGIEPGPLHTYVGWKNLNRQVRRGEKAIWLCMPLTRKRKSDNGDEDQVITSFVLKPNWFVLTQTDGESVPMPEMPAWSKPHALAQLNITETDFNHIDGNALGYARKREIAISPLAPLPHKTLFHELAHVELGHTAELDFNDSNVTPKNLCEVEAEAVAMILLETLELPGSEYARGYIQSWLKNSDIIPEKSAQKIFGAADRILKSGREQ